MAITPERNDPCLCGSGKKYKHCCAVRDARAAPVLRLLGAGTGSKRAPRGRRGDPARAAVGS